MDRIIEIKVGGSYISKDNKNAGVKGEANVTQLRITFDKGWDTYEKKITFWDALGNNPVEWLLTESRLEDANNNKRIYLVPIPEEPMAEAGMLTFVIDGYDEGKRQRSFSDKLEVKDAPVANTAGQPEDPTPSQAEQLQKEITKQADNVKKNYITKVDGIDGWLPNREYKVGMLVWKEEKTGLRFYRCILPHTSGETIDNSKFVQVTPEEAKRASFDILGRTIHETYAEAVVGYKSESEKMITFDETDNVSPIPHFFNVRLEKLPKAEDYTEYKVFAYKDSSLQDIMNTVYFYPNEDGTVEGIHSEYRFIGYNCKKGTLGEMCNGSAILHCTYNKDINAVLKDINAVLSEKANTEDVPTKVSELENDSGFITEEDVNQNFSNAVKATKSGETIVFDENDHVSPIIHNLYIKMTLLNGGDYTGYRLEGRGQASTIETPVGDDGVCSRITSKATTIRYYHTVDGKRVYCDGTAVLHCIYNKDINAALSDKTNKVYVDERIIGKKGDEGASSEIFNDYTNNKASGNFAHAEGCETVASANYTHAEGDRTKAEGVGSHSEGVTTEATGYAAHAEGCSTKATGADSHAEGHYSEATEEGAHAEGGSTKAIAKYAHAEGVSSKAIGEASHAEGQSSVAEAHYSHAEGYCTKAKQVYSHAEGYLTETLGERSHAEGDQTKAEGYASHSEGRFTKAIGMYTHAEGANNEAIGHHSHAEGLNNITKGGNGHIEGNQNRAYGHTPHAEGYKTTALGHGTHAEGASSNKAEDYIFEGDTTAIKSNEDIITEWKTNKFSLVKSEHFTDAADETLTSIDGKQGAGHGEGKDTLSLGYASHAEGRETIAEGDCSHASGYGTHAKRIAQTVVGQFNEIDEDALFVAGNGTDDEHRSNAMVLKTDGTLQVKAVQGLDGKSLLKEEWQLIEDITLTEAVKEIQIQKEKFQYKEVHFEALVLPTDTTVTSQTINISSKGSNLWQGRANPKATSKIYFMADMYITPDNYIACDGNVSPYFYAEGASFTSLGINFLNHGSVTCEYVADFFGTALRFVTDVEDGLGIGTKIKIWGR